MLPLVNHINTPMPIFKGCTLMEIMVLGAISVISSIVILSMITLICWGTLLLGMVLGLFASFGVIHLAIARFARLKANKPAGFYRQWFLLYLARHHLCPNPRIDRQGRWEV
jgi:conjugative transfer region protein (TIGR03750 family)